ncbi:MAG: hypothetical protein IIA59_06145 [Candidatus Marinimicrobia bacterium]|nr:hypothetical protein [Candidatus Neomarinimicrobiota bacterium]
MKSIHVMIAALVLIWACEDPDEDPDDQILEPETLWTRTYGGSGLDVGYSVQQTDDGGFVVAGTTDSFGAGGSDVWLIRLGPE